MEEKKIKVMVEKRGQIYAFDLDEGDEWIRHCMRELEKTLTSIKEKGRPAATERQDGKNHTKNNY